MSLSKTIIVALDQDNLDFLVRSTKADETTGLDPVRMFGRTFNSIVNNALREYRQRLAFNAQQRGRNAA